METYISIVSHGHQSMVMNNRLLAALSDFQIIVCENIPDSERLVPDDVRYILNLRPAGFGSNHNKVFELSQPCPDDWFIICNPDIVATSEQVRKLLTQAENEGAELAAPMLWNNNTDRFDHNVRPRVRLLFLILSFAGIPRPSRYTADRLEKLETADWASGAFIAIKARLFRKLGGFDERYFMYMEDVDLCRRAEILGVRVRYFSNVKMIHNAARDNRKLLSRRFYNHLRSVMRFFLF